MKKRVVVIGGCGKTGSAIVQKLLAQPDKFEVIATARDEKQFPRLQALGLPADCCRPLDLYACPTVTHIANEVIGKKVDAVIIATSAVPLINPLSKIPVALNKTFGDGQAVPTYHWKMDQTPEQIDWFGNKAVVRGARDAGAKHVIYLGRMGGTDPHNPCNSWGRGNLLLFKRKLEQQLMFECDEPNSGLTYTIIHAGDLTEEPAGPRELQLGVDDTLLQQSPHTISWAELAELAIGMVGLPEAANRSFDAISVVPGADKEGVLARVTRLAKESISTWSGRRRRQKGQGPDYGALLSGMQRNCDYSLNDQLHHVTWDPMRTINREELDFKLCCI